jgi:DNA-binding transcriptional ArsR family regulator
MLEKLFGSRLRAKVIGWLFTHPDERFFVRQLTELLGEDSTNLSRELARLQQLGVVTCRLEGRQKYYQANVRSPVCEELKGLAVKTTGLADHLREALKSLTHQIQIAFIYGSFAQGDATSESDVDLILVGDLSSREAPACLVRIGTQLGREINCTVYTLKEFKKKIREKHHFIIAILKLPKIYLVGNEDALKKIIG